METGTINKMMSILRFAADQGLQWNIRTLSTQVDIPRSTVHRLCKVMANNGIFTYDQQTQEYSWGPDMIRIARSVYQGTDFQEMALRILKTVVDQCNETALLTKYNRQTGKLIFAEQVQCDQKIQYHTPIGEELPVHAGASGKAILAFLSEEEIEGIIASGLEPVTNQTIVSPNELRKQLADIRIKGYAITHGERTPGAVGIASPIFDADSNVTGSLLVTIPSYRFRPKMEKSIHLLVRKGAEKLSNLLGYHPVPATGKLTQRSSHHHRHSK